MERREPVRQRQPRRGRARLIELRPNPSLLDLRTVVGQMDDSEREQWAALNEGELDVDAIAASLYLAPGPKWAVTADTRPIVVAGFLPCGPNAYRDWMAYTPEAFILHWRRVTREARRVMDYMAKPGIRLECRCLSTRVPEVVDWYGFLGYGFEGTQRQAGVHGEDLALFSRITPR